ncbi:hypothetical protein LCGC14_0460020 [marine sediment metagenome]|uniref:Uncharacterized protein n=1 Tax=marine sediment metagenome TaxID=412755 RepID=A0A0F9SY14_9ZZZZ
MFVSHRGILLTTVMLAAASTPGRSAAQDLAEHETISLQRAIQLALANSQILLAAEEARRSTEEKTPSDGENGDPENEDNKVSSPKEIGAALKDDLSRRRAQA